MTYSEERAVKMMTIPLDFIIDCSTLLTVESVFSGSGWSGHRYVVRTSCSGVSGPLKGMLSVKKWLIDKEGFLIADKLKSTLGIDIDAMSLP